MATPTESPLLKVALGGDVAAFEKLLAEGANVHERDEYEQCALHFGETLMCVHG